MVLVSLGTFPVVLVSIVNQFLIALSPSNRTSSIILHVESSAVCIVESSLPRSVISALWARSVEI